MTDTIFAWSQIADDNQTADAEAAWQEFMTPDLVNNSARAMMRRVAQLLGDLAPRRTSTGTGNAYIVDGFAAGAVLRNGERIAFLPDRSNTAACTLQVKGRAPKPWRPKPGVEFAADNIRAGVPVEAFYRAETDEWLSGGTGFYLTDTAAGISLQSITARLPRIGDLVVSLAPTPNPGNIRLSETAQSILKTDYPELNSYLSGISYPWGSTATHFTLPPAAGYYLRFAATSNAVDTSGARTAGSTQADANKSVAIPATGLTATTTIPDHSHTYIAPDAGVSNTAATGGSFRVTGGQNATTVPAQLTASTSVGGAATLPGANEVRVKNVAFHLDVIASTALAAAQIAVFGFPYAWDTGTAAADPGAGRVRGNNAAFAASTALHFSATDTLGTDLSTILTSLSVGSIISLSRVGSQINRLVARVSGAPVNNTTYVSVPVVVTASGGAMLQGNSLAAEFSPGGPAGVAGPVGPNTGLDYTWNSATSGDPGSGYAAGNNLTFSNITQIRISKTGRNGEALAGYIATWDDSTNTAHFGHLRLFPLSDRTKFIEAEITALADSGTYYTATVVVSESAGPIANDAQLSVSFARTGNKGADGTNSFVPFIWEYKPTASASIFQGNDDFAVFLEVVPNLATVYLDGIALQREDYTWSPNGRILTFASPVHANQSIVVRSWTSAPAVGPGDMFKANNLSDVASRIVSHDNLSVHGADVASAATVNLDSATGDLVDITGTTNITAITLADGRVRTVRFTGVLTLTNGASLVLPSGANITTAAGDFAIFRGYAAGVVRCVIYSRASGAPLAGGGGGGGDMLAANNLSDVANKSTSFDTLSIRGADVASAATVNLSATGNLLDITGTTTITAVTLGDGHQRTVRFTGILTLTHGASLVLPTGGNITTAAGDYATFRGYAAGVVRCVAYSRASGAALAASGGGGDLLASNNLSDVANKTTSFDNLNVRGADVASAATVNLDTATGSLVDVTGTTTITAFTLADGRVRTVRFTGALTLTNSANLVLPTGANIITAAGDFAVLRGYASSVVRVVSYSRASGQPLAGGGGGASVAQNLLINGDFLLNQRAFAGGSLAVGVYGFDRWKAGTGGCNISLSGAVVTLASGPIAQVIEPAAWNLTTLASTAVTVSVDTPSADLTVTLGSQTGTITTGAGRRSVTLSLGAGDTGNLTLTIAKATGSNVTFGRVKLEIGSAATAWDARPLVQELALASRYCQQVARGTSGGSSIVPAWAQLVGTIIIDCVVTLPVSMRAAPTFLSPPGAPTFQASNPTTGNTIAFYNNVTPGYSTATGAVTMSFNGASPSGTMLRLQAATSFSGTTNGMGFVYIGPTVNILAESEL